MIRLTVSGNAVYKCQELFSSRREHRLVRTTRFFAGKSLVRSLLVGGAISAMLLGGAPAMAADLAPTAPDSENSSTTALQPGESMMIDSQDWAAISTDSDAVPLTAGILGTPAPACVNAVVELGFVQVYNNCGFDVRVKVIMANAPDSACSLVVDGTRHNISPRLGRIDRVELC